ncbi:ceramide glucosyltransferase [bacterium]|nr:ceramide glucosyltransferase [bacterium]
MTLVLSALLLIWALAQGLTLVGTFIGLRSFKKVPPHLDAPFRLYPVTILKPLKGVDSGVGSNLRSFFELEYPEFEILFSIADERDPVRFLVEDLIHSYPKVNARLIVGEVVVGPNPKVNNLIRSYESAQYDLVMISDSNTRVAPDYLRRMVAQMDNNVGIITAAVVGFNSENLGGRLEANFLNTFYARWMHLAASVDRTCVVGKSMLFRRSVAKRFGGIRELARYLAEDYMAGIAMKRLGLRVIVATDPIYQHIGKYSFKQFWDRHLRWGRIRKSQAPLPFLFEPLFTGATLSGLVGALAFWGLFGVSPLLFLSIHFGLWFFYDVIQTLLLEGTLDHRMPVVWALREALSFPLWFHSMIGNTVQWRGKKYTLLPGGLLESL